MSEVRNRRCWRCYATVGVAVVLAATLAAVLMRGTNSQGPDLEPRAGSVGPAACPASVKHGEARPVASRTGLLVPADPTEAVLCTYEYTEGADRLSLGSSRAVPGTPGKLVAYLNDLPSAPGRGSGFSDACALMGRDQYLIVLGYSDRAPLSVRINPNCGTADQGGTVRNLASLKQLLNHWPAQ